MGKLFWGAFHWVLTLAFICALVAVVFFGWVPTQRTIAYIACFAAVLAAHARAVQVGSGDE